MASKTIIEELVVKLGWSISDSDKMKISEFKNSISHIAMKATETVMAINALGLALFAMVNKTAESTEESKIFCDVLDLQYDKFQQLGYAVEKHGGSVEGLKSSLSSLANIQTQFMIGNDSNMVTLARLGVSVVDANGKMKNLEDIYLSLADAGEKFSKAGRGKEFVNLASQLGIGDVKQIAMLEQGRKAILDTMKEANTITSKSVKNAIEFRETLVSLQDSFIELKNVLLEDVAPIFIDLMKDMKIFIKEHKDSIRAIIVGLAEITAWLLKSKVILGAVISLLGVLVAGKVLTFIVSITSAIVSIISAITTLISLITALGAQLALLAINPLVWIPVAIAGIILLATHLEKVTNWMSEMYQKSEIFRTVTDTILDSWNAVCNSIMSAYNAVVNTYDKVKALVSNPLKISVNKEEYQGVKTGLRYVSSFGPGGASFMPSLSTIKSSNSSSSSVNNVAVNATVNAHTNASAKDIAKEINNIAQQHIQTNSLIEKGT